MEATSPLHPFLHEGKGFSPLCADAGEVPVRQRRPFHTSDMDGAELLYAAWAAATDVGVWDVVSLFMSS